MRRLLILVASLSLALAPQASVEAEEVRSQNNVAIQAVASQQLALPVGALAVDPPLGYVAFQNHWSNLCMAVNSTAEFQPIFQYWCQSYSGQYPGQRWYFEPTSISGYYAIKSTYSGYCVAGSTQTRIVIQWNCPLLVRAFLWPGGGWGIQRWSDSTLCLAIWPEDGNYVGDGLVWRNCNNISAERWTIYSV